MSTDTSAKWRVDLLCCGRDDGVEYFETWDQADAFRESYTSGPGVQPNGYSGSAALSGHQRAAILSEVRP